MRAAQSPVEKPEAGRESDNCGWWLLSKNKQTAKRIYGGRGEMDAKVQAREYGS